MLNRVYCLLLAAFALSLGLGVSGEQIIQSLNPSIDPSRMGRLVDGALLLKVMLVVDGVLLLLVGMRSNSLAVSGGQSAYPSLWMPSGRRADLWGGARHYGLAAALILVLALVLRLISLNSDLWIDEVLTLVNFVRLSPGEIVTDFSSDNQHLFFSLLAHLSVSLFGESAWAVRLPSVLFGVASIWAAMRLATLVYGNRVALYTGLLLSLAYHPVWFSQNARGYAILLFGTVYSTWLLLRGLQNGRWRDWIAYALVIAFSAWAHMTAVFVAIAHGVVVVLVLIRAGRLDERRWLPLAGLVLSAWFTIHLYALVLPQMLDFFSQPGAGTGVLQTEWRSPLWLFNEALQSLGIGATLGWLGLAGVLLIGGVCCYWYARHDWVFVLLAVLPGLLLGITMYALGRNLWPRMFFNEAGFIIIFLVVVLLAAGERVRQVILPRASRLVAGLPVMLLAVVFASSLPALYRFPKQDFSGARDYVRQHSGAGDRVVGLHMAGRMYHRYYAPEWAEVNSLEELQQQRSVSGDTWVIYTLPRHIQAVMPEVYRELERNYEVVKVFPGTLGDGDVIVCRSRRHG